MLKLKDIHLGTTDAKNEVLENSPSEVRRFLDSYITPPALSVTKFANRDKYFILGLKGTGKTALLRYVSLELDHSQNAISQFVLFKSDVDEDLRRDFTRAAKVQLVEENSSEFSGDDFELVWRWFIYRKISEVTQFEPDGPFQKDSLFSEFCEIVNSEHLTKKEKTGLMRLIPELKKGTVEISNSPKLGVELLWDQEGRARMSFNDLVRKADHAFERLTPDQRRLNIFFDELELNFSTKKQYQRDSKLVRDLIVAIEKMNALAKSKGFNLCLYAAIRSEVLTSIDAIGKEINKPMADFGSEILWNRPGLSAEQQPLLELIALKINIARAEHNLPRLKSEAIWSQYFPSQMNSQSPQIYILHNSWYRPRDVIRLLLAAQEQYPNEQSFSRRVLEPVRKKYSTASWVEMTEELRVRYTGTEIDGIKYIFYGGRPIATLGDIAHRASKAAEDHKETAELMEHHRVKDILKDLFRIGVIGNYIAAEDSRFERDRLRFSFRGDDEILFDEKIIVHNALRAHLSIAN